jgi:multisubunit Na+/H+ antiporter MnhB subunit
MLGAIDDILVHVRKIGPLVRMLIVGAAGFVAAELLQGLRGPDGGVVQFILHGLSGFMPAMISSWLAHKYSEQTQAATST